MAIYTVLSAIHVYSIYIYNISSRFIYSEIYIFSFHTIYRSFLKLVTAYVVRLISTLIIPFIRFFI